MTRPNFLLFITDQHRVDYLGCYGHPVLKTPHIDSIAARGTRFERFYVATPVCMPNRATLMTGRMPSLHGVRSNGMPLSLLPTPLSMRCARPAMRPRWSAKATCRISPASRRFSSARRRARAIRCSTATFAEALQAGCRRRTLRPGASEALGGRPRLRDARCRSTASSMSISCTGARRSGRRTLLCLAEIATARCRRAARAQATSCRTTTSVPQAFRTPIPEELYPTAYIAEKSCEWLDHYAAGDHATSRSS